jgi:uncharacterized DUF497 family protein
MSSPANFEWDEEKATSNFAKHKISFEASIAAFVDPDALHLDATRQGDGENREKLVGMIEGRLFTVVFTLRDEVVRMISARRANKREEKSYGERPL